GLRHSEGFCTKLGLSGRNVTPSADLFSIKMKAGWKCCKSSDYGSCRIAVCFLNNASLMYKAGTTV
ncbi:hypothetical protein L9F63_005093, partial [Diploptera punctata]